VPCSLVEVYRRFKCPYCLHHQDDDIEAVNTSETSVNFYQTTWLNIPEDIHLHTRRYENLKSHLPIYSLVFVIGINTSVKRVSLWSVSVRHNAYITWQSTGTLLFSVFLSVRKLTYPCFMYEIIELNSVTLVFRGLHMNPHKEFNFCMCWPNINPTFYENQIELTYFLKNGSS
jgi:hypothetical protein